MYETHSDYIIEMELLEGGTLKEHLDRRKEEHNPFTESEASLIMKCIFSGLTHIHHKEFLHRDLKPENIVFGKPGDISSVKIVDFGLAVPYKTTMF
jgi:serine/threonine protein kinase